MTAFHRLLDLALALTAGGRVGVTTPTLMQRIGYEDNPAGKRAFMRDLETLRSVGLVIDNAAEAGEDARYVLKPDDVRMRVEFTPTQLTALRTALATANLAGVVRVERTPPEGLERAQEAVRARCVMLFTYNGKQREVDPQSWQWSGHDLVVLGYERQSDKFKSFAVARMGELSLGPPGSANLPAAVERPQLDPITWKVDPPMRAVLHCPGYVRDTVAMVGGRAVGDDEVHTEVTNRLLFLARVVELGERVVLRAPEDLRTELRAMLEAAR
jgi:predicted DNA-binding transcriptional regulator YafY